MNSKQKQKPLIASTDAQSPLNSCKVLGSRSSHNKKLGRLDRLRVYLRPFFLKLNYHYRLWGNKLDAVIFILIITSIPFGSFSTFLTPILVYYAYLTLLVSFRIFMQWEFFYSSCRMIALWLELQLTKQKGFHNRYARKNDRKNRTN